MKKSLLIVSSLALLTVFGFEAEAKMGAKEREACEQTCMKRGMGMNPTATEEAGKCTCRGDDDETVNAEDLN